jgi:hypothetical protein
MFRGLNFFGVTRRITHRRCINFIPVLLFEYGETLRAGCLGRISKGAKCTVANCGGEAVRSVSVPRAKAAGLDVEGKRAYLCKEHYRDYKKGSKKERQIEKWRYGVA